MIEEFRVSLFAQDLKAALPVSDKRIADQIEKARVEVQRRLSRRSPLWCNRCSLSMP